MKKALLCIVMSVFCFSSCKKDKNPTQPQTDTKKYSVKFNVSGFTTTITTNESKNHVNGLQVNAGRRILQYMVFTADGIVVHELKQASTDTNYGVIADVLPVGSYYISVYSYPEDKLFYTRDMVASNAYATDPAYSNTNPAGSFWDSEIFYKNIPFNVIASTQDVVQDVTVERMVGKLSVQLTDALPANAKKLGITVDKDYSKVQFLYNSSKSTELKSESYSTTIPATALGTTNYIASVCMLNTDTPFTVTITCYDANNINIGQAIVPAVTLKKNTQTILSGKLFGTDTGLGLGINPTWGAPVNISF